MWTEAIKHSWETGNGRGVSPGCPALEPGPALRWNLASLWFPLQFLPGLEIWLPSSTFLFSVVVPLCPHWTLPPIYRSGTSLNSFLLLALAKEYHIYNGVSFLCPHHDCSLLQGVQDRDPSEGQQDILRGLKKSGIIYSDSLSVYFIFPNESMLSTCDLSSRLSLWKFSLRISFEWLLWFPTGSLLNALFYVLNGPL